MNLSRTICVCQIRQTDNMITKHLKAQCLQIEISLGKYEQMLGVFGFVQKRFQQSDIRISST